LWVIIDHICGGVVVGVGGYVWGGVVMGYHHGMSSFGDRGVSVGISVSDDIVIALTSFIVWRMVSTTKCTFCWGISGFRAVLTIVLTTTFDARIWSVAISACVSVLLATCTLRDVIFICSRWLYVNDFILYGRYFVNFFVVHSRFEVHKK
jgi:hypothetical protein